MGRKENLANARNIFFEIMMKISNDKEEWKEFLKFSSKFYKYSFTENLLMYAQNKDVTMCATLEEWNSIGRWVKPKSQSLKILKDAENDTYLEYVFDVKDTYARSDIPNAYTDEKLNVFKWSANENETIDILKEYLNYENVETLRDIISIYVADEIDNAGLLNGLSEDEENIILKPEFMELLVKNTMFQISARCGISVENEDVLFTEYEQIANPKAINILGNCVNHCSEDLLRIVEFKVKQIKRMNRIMALGKYGVILKKNLKELYPVRYSELMIETTLMEKLEEREQEILKQREIIEQQVKEQNPAPQTHEFIVMAKYNQMIENLVEELLQTMLEEKI